MKNIEAVINAFELDEVTAALMEVGVQGFTASAVSEYGAENHTSGDSLIVPARKRQERLENPFTMHRRPGRKGDDMLRSRRSRYLLLVLAAALVTSPLAGRASAEDPPAPNTGAFSFTVNLNMPTSYYFRGIAQSNAGVQFEPYLELKANLYEGGEKDVLTGGYVKAAGFAHFNSVAPPIKTNYYEQDVYLSAGLVFFKRLTLEGGWNLYAYPGIGSSAQVQEVYGKVAFDDGGLWPFKLPGDQDFSLSPYALVAGETSGAADGA
ncbi:MAG TPA: P-II family nitrogen regulator, partial [Candidatus Methylomirabilis sp.]